MLETAFSGEELRRLRKTLIKQIADGTITGFNIYPSERPQRGKFRINYVHAFLGRDKRGQNYSHHLNLENRLQEAGLHSLELEPNLVRHQAAYALEGIDWVLEDMDVYDASGQRISPSELGNYESILIGERFQQDLSIDVDSKEKVARVIQVLQGFANYYQLDEDGNYITKGGSRQINPVAIPESYKVPVYSLAPCNLDLRGVVEMSEVRIFKERSFCSIFVHEKEVSLIEALASEGFSPVLQKRLGNKVLVDWMDGKLRLS